MDEAWREFEVTGKVTDYLNFKRTETENVRSAADGGGRKERPDGTECYGDGDGLKMDAGRGL